MVLKSIILVKKKKLLKESCSSLNGKFPEIRKCIKVKNHV